MEHKDLLEDVILAVLVTATTLGTLYIGWRTGRAARRRAAVDAAGRTGEVREPADTAVAGHEPVEAWHRRLVSENARAVRHGATATVVALRLGAPKGPISRRMLPERERTLVGARLVARNSRASDVIGVTNDGTVRILLIETSEETARVWVDRVSGTIARGLAIEERDVVAAWASIAPSRDLCAADRLAVARLRGATSGWLRSLAVHRATAVEPTVAGSLASDPAAPTERLPG